MEPTTPGPSLSYCGYHDGFDIAIAGVVWSGLTALLVWFWLPWEAAAVDAKAMPAGFSAIASGGGAAGSSGDYVKDPAPYDSGAAVAVGGGYQ